MCLLALMFRVLPDAPVVAAANREEAYSRGGEPPRILNGSCPAVAGVDPVAGGTWFGVNRHGVLVAVTNREKSQAPPRPRSRGLLARDLLQCSTAKAATELATRELDQNRYNGCNFLCADRESASVIHAGDWLRVRPLPPGIHVLTARDVNDLADARIAHSLSWLSQRSFAGVPDCLAAMRQLCGQTGNGGPPVCLRGKLGGTVSSTLVAIREPLEESKYLHCQGPPDRGVYTDYSRLLAELETAASNRT
jgi:hypothetical protein